MSKPIPICPNCGKDIPVQAERKGEVISYPAFCPSCRKPLGNLGQTVDPRIQRSIPNKEKKPI